jgi:NodT family efflux transporter outer membrane factor (OMF) lipoprotein
MYRMALATLVAILTTGCMVGPEYQPPATEVAETWSLTDSPVLSGDPADPKDWWSSFGDPVLDKLVEQAWAGNLTLKTAGMRILQARAERGISVGNFFPQTQDVFGSAQRIRNGRSSGPDIKAKVPAGGAAPKVSVGRSFDDYSFGAQVGWELDFWGRFRRAIEASDAELESAHLDYGDTSVLLTSELASAYISLRTFQARREVAISNTQVRQNGYDLAQAVFQSGGASELDTDQALVQLREAEASIPLFDAAIRQTENQIAILLGMPPSDMSWILADNRGIPEPPETLSIGVPADLLRRRADVRQAEREAAAQCARIGIAEADFYPSLSLFGDIGYETNSSSDLTGNNNQFGTYGAGFSWKILNYGRISNNVRVQDALFQESIFTYQNSVLQAAGEVENAGVAYLMDRERTPILLESVEAAQRAVDISTTQYQQGAITFTRVLDSQGFLFNQEDQLAINRGDVILDLVNLYRSLGGGWEERRDLPWVDPETMSEMSERTDWGDMLTPEDGSWSDGMFPPPEMDSVPRAEPADPE